MKNLLMFFSALVFPGIVFSQIAQPTSNVEARIAATEFSCHVGQPAATSLGTSKVGESVQLVRADGGPVFAPLCADVAAGSSVLIGFNLPYDAGFPEPQFRALAYAAPGCVGNVSELSSNACIVRYWVARAAMRP